MAPMERPRMGKTMLIIQPSPYYSLGSSRNMYPKEKNGSYFAMGSNSGQSYLDLGYDPAEDSSWFDEIIKPLELDEVAPY